MIVKKEYILFTLILLLLSGCGGGQKKVQTHRNYMRDDMMSELDIDVVDDVRSFFDNDEDPFSESEFIGFADGQELLDLDEAPLPESLFAMNEDDFCSIEDDGETVLVVVENNSTPDLMDEPKTQVETAIDVIYYPENEVKEADPVDMEE